MVPSTDQLTDELKQRAQELGFQSAGVCPAVAPDGLNRFAEWLASGYAGQMHYLSDRSEAYAHPRYVLDGVKSILVLAMDYRTAEPAPSVPGSGRVSRYAWGTADYHDLIRDRLHQLADFLRQQQPGARVRGVVDTAPLLEREFAQLAGLGWIGKNTLLLNKHAGSWFFLAALLTDCELRADEPHLADHCGTCRACLDACPTDAFPQPYVLDATRCISYLTIELRDAIPASLRGDMQDWIFGCDVCQDVCPWNHRAPLSSEIVFAPAEDMNLVELAELLELDDDAFRKRFRHTPLWRSKRRGLLRNAAIALGNHPTDDALTSLVHGLRDSEPLVRGACAWALGRFDNRAARHALEDRVPIEDDKQVRLELADALQVESLPRNER